MLNLYMQELIFQIEVVQCASIIDISIHDLVISFNKAFTCSAKDYNIRYQIMNHMV